MSIQSDNRYSSFMTIQENGVSLDDALSLSNRVVVLSENTYRTSTLKPDNPAFQNANKALAELLSVFKKNMGIAAATELNASTARSTDEEPKSENSNTFKPF